jgi:hypothetical protein
MEGAVPNHAQRRADRRTGIGLFLPLRAHYVRDYQTNGREHEENFHQREPRFRQYNHAAASCFTTAQVKAECLTTRLLLEWRALVWRCRALMLVWR